MTNRLIRAVAPLALLLSASGVGRAADPVPPSPTPPTPHFAPPVATTTLPPLSGGTVVIIIVTPGTPNAPAGHAASPRPDDAARKVEELEARMRQLEDIIIKQTKQMEVMVDQLATMNKLLKLPAPIPIPKQP
jgi:Spy/CpxP family protein refolding chaperone